MKFTNPFFVIGDKKIIGDLVCGHPRVKEVNRSSLPSRSDVNFMFSDRSGNEKAVAEEKMTDHSHCSGVAVLILGPLFEPKA